MNLYQIDKTEPVPDRQSRRKGKWTDIVRKMEIGDSTVVANEKERVAISMCMRRHGYSVKTRYENDGLYRVWKAGFLND